MKEGKTVRFCEKCFWGRNIRKDTYGCLYTKWGMWTDRPVYYCFFKGMSFLELLRGLLDKYCFPFRWLHKKHFDWKLHTDETGYLKYLEEDFKRQVDRLYNK